MEHNKMIMVPAGYIHPTYASQTATFMESMTTLGYDETVRRHPLPNGHVVNVNAYVPLNYDYQRNRNRVIHTLEQPYIHSKRGYLCRGPDPRYYMCVDTPMHAKTHYMMFLSKEHEDGKAGYIPISGVFSTKKELVSHLVQHEVSTAFGPCGDEKYWTAVVEHDTEEGESPNLRVTYHTE